MGDHPASEPATVVAPTSRVVSMRTADAAFIELYRAHFDYVWRSARRLGVSRAEADDLVQETFLNVHRLLRTCDPKGSPRAWLFSVLHRVVQRHRRSYRRRTALTDEGANPDEVPDSSAPDKTVETAETLRMLEVILDELDPEKRAVLVLAEIEERSLQEIADILGLKLKTAASRLRLAREHVDVSLARHRARDGWRLK